MNPGAVPGVLPYHSPLLNFFFYCSKRLLIRTTKTPKGFRRHINIVLFSLKILPVLGQIVFLVCLARAVPDETLASCG